MRLLRSGLDTASEGRRTEPNIAYLNAAAPVFVSASALSCDSRRYFDGGPGSDDGTETCSCTINQFAPRFSQMAVWRMTTWTGLPPLSAPSPFTVADVHAIVPRAVVFTSSLTVNAILSNFARMFGPTPALYSFQPVYFSGSRS